MTMPSKIWAVTPSRENGCVVSFTTPSLDYKHPYIRADIAEELARAFERLIDGGCHEKAEDALARFRAVMSST